MIYIVAEYNAKNGNKEPRIVSLSEAQGVYNTMCEKEGIFPIDLAEISSPMCFTIDYADGDDDYLWIVKA